MDNEHKSPILARLPEAKRVVVEQSRVTLKLLTCRWAGEPLKPKSPLVLYGMVISCIFLDAAKLIAGVADAGPINAVLMPGILVAMIYFIGQALENEEVLPAFLRMAIGVNLIVLLALIIGIDDRMFQWLMEILLRGSLVFFIYKNIK